MRALTLTQPWAGLVASGRKLVENRPMRIIKAEDFGKPFGLHASREIHEHLYDQWREKAPYLFGDGLLCDEPWWKLTRHKSAIIAVATVVDALYIGGCDEETIRKGLARIGYEDQLAMTFGPTVYVLERNPRVLPTPVPARGYQGFWRMSADVEREVNEQLAKIPCA